RFLTDQRIARVARRSIFALHGWGPTLISRRAVLLRARSSFMSRVAWCLLRCAACRRRRRCRGVLFIVEAALCNLARAGTAALPALDGFPRVARRGSRLFRKRQRLAGFGIGHVAIQKGLTTTSMSTSSSMSTGTSLNQL